MSVDTRTYEFDVFLDKKKIGFQRFSVDASGKSVVMETTASFEIKFLFFTAYTYEHQNREVWENGCVVELESDTKANGKDHSVRARKLDKGLEIVATTDGKTDTSVLTGCVKSFAYWDPEILTADKLLNSQTGKQLDVAIEERDTEEFSVKGVQSFASRYHLDAEGMDLDIFYSPDDQWIGLRSTVKGGRMLRYELR